MADDDGLRACAGVMLFNRDGRVFVGERIDNPGKNAWQMPQGGIDDGEDPREAALRELAEETGIARDKVEIVARSRQEHCYELPPELKGRIWGGRWIGQRQRWFLARFLGEDSDVAIATAQPEFCRWQWVEPERAPELIVPFKRDIYAALVEEFGPLIRASLNSPSPEPR